jgi:tetratricopeptide (TPR) repeat protein
VYVYAEMTAEEEEVRCLTKFLSEMRTRDEGPLDVNNALSADVGKLYQILVKRLKAQNLDGPPEEDTKSAENANCFRTLGNDLLEKGQFEEALLLFTKSVAMAPHTSEELAMAYADRSRLLFVLGCIDSCLLDVNRALKGNKYPEAYKKKLRMRKAQCLLEQRKEDERKASAHRVKSDTTDSQESKSGQSMNERPCSDGDWLALCIYDNKLLPKTSSKIKLACNDKWGRHVIATERINLGKCRF